MHRRKQCHSGKSTHYRRLLCRRYLKWFPVATMLCPNR
uniref:Uncharacterized protein n=1 Tax=Rhizophora mucronata TaxID=61149 RepID=A0A2P2MWZ3_RHIMU